ncbi:MAG: hypothetical protein DMG35_19065 [Acidobacteria bacterium]|nr:MAG: hypothetical protein AUH86_16540 [Acidobacteria bacterium 13_1_40CM_4_58_4]PYT57988.1 MAG: hypothetical protein DMG35_19065 [Acidobacteriota bacterium]
MAICYFLLLVILPRAAWSQRNRVFGDPASPAALILGQSQQDTRLMQQRQVNIAGSAQTQKYSAFCSLPQV